MFIKVVGQDNPLEGKRGAYDKYSRPCLGDIDNDGMIDLLIGVQAESYNIDDPGSQFAYKKLYHFRYNIATQSCDNVILDIIIYAVVSEIRALLRTTPNTSNNPCTTTAQPMLFLC